MVRVEIVQVTQGLFGGRGGLCAAEVRQRPFGRLAHRGDGLRRNGRGTLEALLADEAAACRREPESHLATTAGGALVEHRHVARLVQHLEKGAEEQRRLQGGPAQTLVELPERVAQQGEHTLLGLVHGRETGDRLADDGRHSERLAVVTQAQEDVDQVRLGDGVHGAAGVQHQVADIERFQTAAPLGRSLAHALDDRVHTAHLAREEAQDAISLTEWP